MLSSAWSIVRFTRNCGFSYLFIVDKASSVSGVNKMRDILRQSNSYFLNSVAVALVLLVFGSCSVMVYRGVHQWHQSSKDHIAVSNAGSSYDCIIQVICVMTLCLLFLLLRLGTFRLLPALSNGSSASGMIDENEVELINNQFNHKETDELIFQVSSGVYSLVLHYPSVQKLTAYVSRNLFDYSLKDKDIIRQFNLAPENYSDSLFIHPPLFVYLSAFLIYCCKLTLPAVPILYQLVTLLLIPAITPYVDPTLTSPRQHQQQSYYVVNHTSLTAMVVLLCCPLCAFCSQKFWIDSCLIMCVTICVAGHFWLLDTRKLVATSNKKEDDSANSFEQTPTQFRSCFVSGLVFFGGIAMHCKITSVGLLPVLVGWIVLQRCLVNATSGNRSHFNDVARHVGVFLVGTTVAYSPWALLYHVSHFN